MSLNGVQQTKLNPSGVTITSELERLFPILVAKRKQANTKGTEFTKRVLFDACNSYFIGYNMNFTNREHAKYRDAMKLIAIGTTNKQWAQLTGNDIDPKAMRGTVSEIKKSTLVVLKRLQTDHLQFDPKRKFKATESIRALGDNARTVFNKVAVGRSELRQQEWLSEKLGESRQPGEQQTLHAALTLGNCN